jgi:hypothetical protein
MKLKLQKVGSSNPQPSAEKPSSPESNGYPAVSTTTGIPVEPRLGKTGHNEADYPPVVQKTDYKSVEVIPDGWRFQLGVTASLLNDFLLCPEKMRLGYVERLRPKATKAYLEWGDLTAKAQEFVRKESIKDDCGAELLLTQFMAESYAAARADFIKNGETEFQSLEERYGTVQIVLEGYFEYFGGNEHREWTALESEFDFLYNNIRFRGKRDGVYKTAGGHGLQEDKTKGRIDVDLIFDKLHFDTQTMLYLLSMREEGLNPTEVTYSVVRRPQLKRKQSETLKDFLQRIREDIKTRPEFYFIQKMAEVDEEDFARWEGEFKQQVSVLRSGTSYRNSNACGAYGVTCQFFPICTQNDRSEFVQKEKVFMELTE